MQQKQTAMQELIEFMDTLPFNNVLTEWILAKATELLETEKKQIELAFKDSYRNGRVHPGNNMNKDFEQYFNQTFNK